jgi:hypothetical protein
MAGRQEKGRALSTSSLLFPGERGADWCGLNPFSGVKVDFLSAAHHLAWTQYPATWLCESCAILWLVLRATRSSWARAGVLLMLSGLMLNAAVTEANAGVMPVVGMPSTLRPSGPMWGAATPTTRLSFLADQARLGLFSVGDLMLLFGGIVIVGVGLRRTFELSADSNCRAHHRFGTDNVRHESDS